MQTVNEIQKAKIADTIMVYIAAIPANSSADIDSIINSLESLKSGNNIKQTNIPTAMQEKVNTLVEYLEYLFQCASEVKQALTDLLNQVIQERITALREIQSNEENIAAYSRAQKNLGAGKPRDKYHRELQVLLDFYLIEKNYTRFESDLNILDLILSDRWDQNADKKKLTETALKNELVIQALQKDTKLLEYIASIQTEKDYPHIINYAKIITTDERNLKLLNYGLWHFYSMEKTDIEAFTRYINALSNPILFQLIEKNISNIREIIRSLDIIKLEELTGLLSHPLVGPLVLEAKININKIVEPKKDPLFASSYQYDFNRTWSKEEIIKVAEILSIPSVKHLVDQGHIDSYDVFTWGEQETLRIVEFASQESIQALMGEKLYALKSYENYEKNQARAVILLKFQDDIKKLISDEIITHDDVAALIYSSPEKCQLYISLIQQNLKYFKLGILSVIDLKKLETGGQTTEFFKCLNKFPSIVHQFLAYGRVMGNFSVINLESNNNNNKRETYFDALCNPDIREVLAAKALTADEVITAFKDYDTKNAFITALTDPAIRKRLYDNEDSVFKRRNKYKYEDRVDAIISVGEDMVIPQIFPLVQFGYLTSEEITTRRRWQPEALEILVKYKLLLDLQEKFSDTMFKALGQFGKNLPDSITELQQILLKLDSIKVIKARQRNCDILLSDYTDYGSDEKFLGLKHTINGIFNEVDKILSSKQPPNGTDTRNAPPKILSDFFTKVNHLLGKADDSVLQPLLDEGHNMLREFKTATALDTHYKIGKFYLDNGNTRDAYEYFTRTIETDPNYCDAMLEAGNIAFANSQYEEASYLLTKALDSAPANKESIVRDIKILLASVKASLKGEVYMLNETLSVNQQEKKEENIVHISSPSSPKPG